MDRLLALLLMLTCFGCAAGFADRLPIYRQCARDAAIGGIKAIALAKSLQDVPHDEAASKALAQVSGSDLPLAAGASCAKAAETAKAAIQAGKAGK